jgi:hypothetical protein
MPGTREKTCRRSRATCPSLSTSSPGWAVKLPGTPRATPTAGNTREFVEAHHFALTIRRSVRISSAGARAAAGTLGGPPTGTASIGSGAWASASESESESGPTAAVPGHPLCRPGHHAIQVSSPIGCAAPWHGACSRRASVLARRPLGRAIEPQGPLLLARIDRPNDERAEDAVNDAARRRILSRSRNRRQSRNRSRSRSRNPSRFTDPQ